MEISCLRSVIVETYTYLPQITNLNKITQLNAYRKLLLMPSNVS